jgi:hypothetical protein
MVISTTANIVEVYFILNMLVKYFQYPADPDHS